MHLVISGPAVEPKVGGDIVHIVCPECASYQSSVPVARPWSGLRERRVAA